MHSKALEILDSASSLIPIGPFQNWIEDSNYDELYEHATQV